MAQFDPYHMWLGIPPQDQPPHHYRLLGLNLFESDPNVIDMAANRQMTFLKQCAAGPHVESSQNLLNEIAAARLCLLKPDAKSRYDATLKSHVAAEAKPPDSGNARASAAPPAAPARRDTPGPPRSHSPRSTTERGDRSKHSAVEPAEAFPASDVQDIPRSSRSRPGRRSISRPVQIGAGLVGGVILLTGLWVGLQPKPESRPPNVAQAAAPANGGALAENAAQAGDATLVVEIDEPDAEVQVRDAEGKLEAQQRANADSGSQGKIVLTLRPGQHQLKVVKQGFEPDVRDIALRAGERQTIRAQLQMVETDPSVVVDETPLPLASGPAPPKVQKQALPESAAAARWVPTAAFQTWISETSVLPADEQVTAVAKKLQELNPGFGGKVKPTLNNGQVEWLEFETDQVTDLSPVRGVPTLKSLKAAASSGRLGKVSNLSPLAGLPLTSLSCKGNDVTDITPLEGMKLTFLSLSETQVADVSPLRDMPITFLELNSTRVTDFSPLRDLPLTIFVFEKTRVSDLSPLAGKKITFIALNGTDVTDLSPLKDMPLKLVMIDAETARKGQAVLQSIATLEHINFKPVADFWKENGGTEQ